MCFTVNNIFIKCLFVDLIVLNENIFVDEVMILFVSRFVFFIVS